MANKTDIGITISTKLDEAVKSANKLNNSLTQTSNILKKLGVNSNSIKTATSSINSSKVKTAGNNAQKASSQFGMLSKSISKATNGLQKGFSLGKMYWAFNTLKPITDKLANIIQKSVDFTETVNLFNNTMGEMTGKATEFQNKLSEAFGTAQTGMMNYQATYKNMLSALGGLSDQASEKISETLTLMSIDYASLYNVEMEDSAQKFQSALSRQVRPIRSTSGYDITQNVLGDYLQQAGIYDREVSDLSEMEKRLLIIYSLQKQMANSHAFGDFARTIESPANQLRILQEQLSETGRWIGSVFYTTIGKVLPYINGFVMAVKEAVKWVALLMGYSVEDYATGGNTYFDQAFGDAGDILDDASSGVGKVNDSLDDTKKKAKEVKEQLSSLDELNVITSTSDSSSGKSDSDSGLGSAGIDPRLLSALGEYEDMLDSIRMKANDIRDKLLEWGSIIGDYVTENIFKPMSVSWDKYGESIISRMNDGFSNIGSVLGDAFNITLKRLPDLVGSATSLCFSLLDDLAIAFDGLTKMFKNVWDNGGNVLYEQLLRLAQALMDLATSINDNFVKPIITWFSDNLAPTLGTVLGKLLKLIGDFVGILADVTSALSKNESAVKAVCTVLTTMYGLYKTAKIVEKVTEWIDVYKGFKTTGESVLSALNMTLQYHSQKYLDLTTTIVDTSNKASGAFSTMKSGLSALGNLGSNVFNTLISSGSSTTSVFGSLASMTQNTDSAMGIFGMTVNALTSPVGLLITGLVTLSGVAMCLTRDYNGLTGSAKELNDAYVKQQKAIDETTKEINKNQEATKKKIASSEAEFTVIEKSIDKLNEMVDANGKINGSQETASYLVEQINQRLGTNITIQDGVIQNWNEEKVALDKTIESMKLKARVEAHYDEYVKALERETSLSKELTSAKRALASNEENLSKKKAEYNDLISKGSRMTDEEVSRSQKLANQISDLVTQHGQLEKNVKSAQKAVNSNQKSIDDYDLACKALSGEVSDLAKSMANDYLKMDSDSKATWKSMAQGLADLTEKKKQYLAQGKDINSQEVQSTTEATNLIVAQMVEKAKQHGYSYNEMLSNIASKGVKLTSDEKKILKEQYDNFLKNKADVTSADVQKWNTMSSQNEISMSNINKKVKSKLDTALSLFQQNGDKSGMELCAKLANSLRNNNGRVNSETQSIIDQIISRARGANPTVNVKSKLDSNSLQGVVNSVSRTVGNVWSTIKLSLPHFATGGFPEDGLFMANHGEMVGKFSNGKTAVANNSQIVEGIKAGVLEAMKEAGGDTNRKIVIPVYIGKKKIMEEIQDANKEEYMMTGKVKFGT